MTKKLLLFFALIGALPVANAQFALGDIAFSQYNYIRQCLIYNGFRPQHTRR